MNAAILQYVFTAWTAPITEADGAVPLLEKDVRRLLVEPDPGCVRTGPSSSREGLPQGNHGANYRIPEVPPPCPIPCVRG